MKFSALILTFMGTLAWGVDEVSTYAEGRDQVKEDGWVLLCYSADWDDTHDESWMRRQTSISSACGSALILYVPIYQEPTPEQEAEAARILEGSSLDYSNMRSIPCAILLDKEGRPYANISGDSFTESAAGLIRQAQAQLRTRNNLLREADEREGANKAHTLSSIWRLSIPPPPGLQEQIRQADPEDTAGIAEWSPFDPWAFAKRIHALPWEQGIAELERAQQAPLSKEERQAVLAVHMGYVYHHLAAAGAQEIRKLGSACTSLAPGSALGKAAERAAKIWGENMKLETGWHSRQLPRIAADCEVSSPHEFLYAGEYRLLFTPTGGQDTLRITAVTLYDGDTKVCEDAHDCSVRANTPQQDNEYMLLLNYAPARPRLVISLDQQGKTDSRGTFTLRFVSP